MAESIEDAFMREDAIGQRQFLDRIRYSIEHSSPRISPSNDGHFTRPDCSSPQNADVEGADRPVETLEVELAERFQLGDFFNCDLDPAIDQNLPVIGVRAQARSEIDHRAGRRIVKAS